jgi:hypothetical protein
VCYSLTEFYVKYVYLNLFGWGATFMKLLKGGVQAIKVWEPLYYTQSLTSFHGQRHLKGFKTTTTAFLREAYTSDGEMWFAEECKHIS